MYVDEQGNLIKSRAIITTRKDEPNKQLTEEEMESLSHDPGFIELNGNQEDLGAVQEGYRIYATLYYPK